MIYLLLLSIFFIYIKHNDVKKFDAISKNTILELYLVDNIIQNIKLIYKESTKLNEYISKKTIEKKTSKTSKKQTDIKSLFKNFKNKVENISTKESLNIKPNQIISRFKSKFKKNRKNSNKMISKLLNTVRTKSYEGIITNTNHQNDLYYSKIYKILSSRWKPKVIVENLFVNVLITISKNGKFNYIILRNSKNVIFNNELKEFLENEKKIRYPLHNRGFKQKIEVKFISKKG